MSFVENFRVGDRWRHSRGTTVGEVENQLITKLVLNSAQGHFNDHAMEGTPYGRRLVFGLVTASLVVGMATQDTAEHAIAEIGLDKLRFAAPVFHGDTLYAATEVIDVSGSDREDAGVVRFKHWGFKSDETLVFEGERSVLLRRRPPDVQPETEAAP